MEMAGELLTAYESEMAAPTRCQPTQKDNLIGPVARYVMNCRHATCQHCETTHSEFVEQESGSEGEHFLSPLRAALHW